MPCATFPSGKVHMAKIAHLHSKATALTDIGNFFYRESFRRGLTEKAWQRRVGCLRCWWRTSGEFFLQGEPQEKAYRESLSEACGVLEVLVKNVWGERLERKLRNYYGLIRSTPSRSVREATQDWGNNQLFRFRAERRCKRPRRHPE